MKKQLFIASIEALQKQYEKDLAISKLLGKAFETKPENVEPNHGILSVAFQTILEELMEDENGLIDKYCHIFDFGAKTMCFTFKDKLHYINTPSDLYFILESLRIEKLKNELIKEV